MVAASLLLLQIFTETTAPMEKGHCVGVVYKGTTYKGKKAVRYRFSGRVVITMSDVEVPPTEVPPTNVPSGGKLTASPHCQQKCGKAEISRRFAEQKFTLSIECTETEYDCNVMCLVEELLGKNARGELPVPPAPQPTATPKMKPGREIELAGADLITESTTCSCSYNQPCIDR